MWDTSYIPYIKSFRRVWRDVRVLGSWYAEACTIWYQWSDKNTIHSTFSLLCLSKRFLKNLLEGQYSSGSFAAAYKSTIFLFFHLLNCWRNIFPGKSIFLTHVDNWLDFSQFCITYFFVVTIRIFQKLTNLAVSLSFLYYF